MQNMLVDDLVDVFAVHIGVPDRIRIHHQHRPLFTTIQTAGLVDAHLAGPGQVQLLDALLGVITRSLRADRRAAWPLGIGCALVTAEKQVTLVVTHCCVFVLRPVLNYRRNRDG